MQSKPCRTSSLDLYMNAVLPTKDILSMTKNLYLVDQYRKYLFIVILKTSFTIQLFILSFIYPLERNYRIIYHLLKNSLCKFKVFSILRIQAFLISIVRLLLIFIYEMNILPIVIITIYYKTFFIVIRIFFYLPKKYL